MDNKQLMGNAAPPPRAAYGAAPHAYAAAPAYQQVAAPAYQQVAAPAYQQVAAPAYKQAVVVGQQAPGGIALVNGQFQAQQLQYDGLFDCFDDMDSCLLGTCCAYCVAGQTHQRAGTDSSCTIPIGACAGSIIYNVATVDMMRGVSASLSASGGAAAAFTCTPMMLLGQGLICGSWLRMCLGRNKIEARLGMQPTDGCETCCIYTWCVPCAICQEARVVKRAWIANGYQPLTDRPMDMVR
jgi:Cys-rich protein (TIGR01571 family)